MVETAIGVRSQDLQAAVEEQLRETPVLDVHTHLFTPSLGRLGLWGIDELLTYHYLEAELFRSSAMTPEQYWSLSKPHRAEAIWNTLFVENTPVSEATRGVIAVLHAFGLPRGSTWRGLASISPRRLSTPTSIRYSSWPASARW